MSLERKKGPFIDEQKYTQYIYIKKTTFHSLTLQVTVPIRAAFWRRLPCVDCSEHPPAPLSKYSVHHHGDLKMMTSTTPCSTIQQMQDRSFSATVSHVSLCPNMDLLALALDGNSIAIFRLSWNRLATISVTTAADDTITSLVWSPSGAHLAVGTSTGLLCVHSVDRAASAPPSRTRRAARDSEPVATLRHPVAASAILWTHVPHRRVVYADRSAQLVDTRPPAVVEDGLLFIGGVDGTITILTTNLAFNVARVQLLPPNYAVGHIRMSSDRRDCVAIGYKQSQQNNTNANNDNILANSSQSPSTPSHHGNCMIRIMRTDFLLKYWSEIERVSLEAAALQSQIPSIQGSIKQVEETWSKGVRDVLFTGIAASMNEAMREFAQAGSIWDELYDIFCGSRVHGAALHCLVQLIGEGGAKEYLRSFRAHDDDAETAITALLPLVQNLLSRASEYSGIICLADQFADIGVREEDVGELFLAAEGLFIRVCGLSRELEATSNETEAFLTWLVIAAVKASGEATTQSRLSSNIPALGGKELELVGKFFEKATAISAGGTDSVATSAITAILQDKIQPWIKRVTDASETIIRKPFETISKALPAATGISLRMDNGYTAAEKNWFMLDGPSGDDRRSRMTALTATGDGNLVWARCELTSQRWTVGQMTLHGDASKVMGAGLRAEDSMVLVLSRNSSDSEAHEVRLYNPVDDGVWSKGKTVVCKEAEVCLVELDHTAALNKPLHTKTISGCKTLTKNAVLNVNCSRSVMRYVAFLFCFV